MVQIYKNNERIDMESETGYNGPFGQKKQGNTIYEEK